MSDTHDKSMPLLEVAAVVISEGMDNRAMIERYTDCPVGTHLYKYAAVSATRAHTPERLPANERIAKRLNEDGSVTPACIFRKGCQKVAICVVEQRCCANEGGPDAVTDRTDDRG
jgi:hypothetical protein